LIDVNDGAAVWPSRGAMTRTLAFTAALAALALATFADARPSAERGRAMVERSCAMCHAVGPTGDSPNAAAPPFRELHKRYPVENLAEALAEGIVTGHPMMPEFKLSPRQIDDLIAYLKSLQTRQHAGAAGNGLAAR
jgi:mono/diheme cytochrome c family protein